MEEERLHTLKEKYDDLNRKYDNKKRVNAGLREANSNQLKRLRAKDAEIARLKEQLSIAKKRLKVKKICLPKKPVPVLNSSSNPTSPTRLPKSLPEVPVPEEPKPVDPLRAELKAFKEYLLDYWLLADTSQGVNWLQSNIDKTIGGLEKFGFTDYAEQVRFLTEEYDPEESELSTDRCFHKSVAEYLGDLKLKLPK